MPYRKNYRRPYRGRRRKRYGKKRFYKKRMSRYYKPSLDKSLFGNRKTVKLRYHENFHLQIPVSGIPGSIVFRANSVFDPDQTGIGHQPRGFDQLMPLYQHFTVIGAKCSVWFSIPNTAVDQPLVCGIDLRSNTQVQTVLSNLIEDRNCKYVVQAPNSPSMLVEKTFSAKNFFSVSNPLDRGNLRGSDASNPIEQAYFHVFASNTNPDSITNHPVDFTIVINYIVTFHEPINPPIS